ncbi:LytR/AlgR family response regulator transcription factor [Ferruginibacter sp. SUN106]|uniref:LytR/AlgR family response regulator transcription factor n=1 Tax=Ferruginibacter sp. SUN106 TaxID=2978348 RepID=UPI003D367346
MINCLIIDDEQPAIEIIEDYVKKVPYMKCVATTTNPVEGLAIINKENINLVFLDIQMPYLTGIDFVKAIQGKCKVIFTTAYDKFAIEGFELDIIDYLLKPVPFTRFLKAAQKAFDIFETEENKKPAAGLPNYIMLRGDTKGSFVKVELTDIDYIEATGNYVCVVCGNKKIIAHTKMSTLENLLPAEQFIRVQKSYIVNIFKIATINGNSIKLKNNEKADIIIGSTYKEAFLEIVRNRLADN